VPEPLTDHAGGKNEIQARPFTLMPFTLMTKMFLITTVDFDRHNCVLPIFITTPLLVFLRDVLKMHEDLFMAVGIAQSV
jgi:hypothetical protein